MKLSEFKASIDAYFETADPHEIIARFEALGYVFEDIKPEPIMKDKNAKTHLHRCLDPKAWRKRWKRQVATGGLLHKHPFPVRFKDPKRQARFFRSKRAKAWLSRYVKGCIQTFERFLQWQKQSKK